MQNPMLTSCCGQHFCAECIRTVTSSNQPCPLCKERAFVVFLNKHFNRNLQNLKAFCNLKPSGCPWEGTIGEFAHHRALCDYASVTCDVCGTTLRRKLLPDHRDNECPLRKVACELCGLEGHHRYVRGPHQAECPGLPVQCPNGCNVHVPRADMSRHLAECLYQLVHCPFRHLGCSDEFPRSESGSHSRDSATNHLSLVCASLRALQESFLAKAEAQDRALAELEKRVGEKDKYIEMLLLRLQGLETYVSSSLPGNLPAIFTTTLTGFAKFKANSDAWFSPPFYTSPSGYKMSLKVHTATGNDMAVHVHVLRGEFDASLRWPLTAEVTVELVNHFTDKSNHCMKRKATWHRVVNGEQGAGFGWGNFFAYKHLTTKDSSYVQADSLTFRVTSFDIIA